MKKIGWLIWIMALLPCLAMAQSPGDDVYFVPKKQKDDKKTEKVTAKSAGDVLNATQKKGNGVGTVVVRDYTGRTRDIDEYNRREYVKEKMTSPSRTTPSTLTSVPTVTCRADGSASSRARRMTMNTRYA